MKKPHQSPITTRQPAPPQEKNTRFSDLTGEMFSFLDKPARAIDTMIYRMQNVVETNVVIGQEMADKGLFRDAIIRLRIALWFAPQHPQAWYVLGCCYISLENMDKAKAALRQAVKLNPANENAIFMLATLDSNAVTAELYPTHMPYDIVQDYFTSHAATFEVMQHDSGYKGHQLADMAVWDALDRRRTNYQVLELGCGTGLCGVLLAERSEELVGVDFNRSMLDVAKIKRRPDNRRVYTETMLQDIRHYMADIQKPRFHAVVAAHVFNYVGDIAELFDGMARCLLDEGVCIFQVERYSNENSFGLVPGMGRFGHSDGYVRHHLHRVGLTLLSNDIVRVYPDYEMVQYVARKPESTESST